MKILVLSDSHGNVENMVRAVDAERPDLLAHLGDCWRDGLRLRERFPNIPMEQVPGNCDFRSREAPERLLILEDKRVLLCHGHTFNVKTSMVLAGDAAVRQDLDLFLFGHTHKPFVDRRGKALFLNPGAIGEYARPSYGVVMLGQGYLDACTVRLD